MPLETVSSLPGDLAAAHATILAERAARLEAEARVSSIAAEVSDARLEIERLKLLLAKARRERFGQSAERGARLVEQLELQLAELEETVAEEDAAAELAALPARPEARARPGRRPARRPLPENLLRERIVYPAPSHPIARGRAGPNLLALVLAAKYGQHLPLTRQSAIYAGEGVEIEVSTLADWVGASAAGRASLVLAVRAHVFAAERLHADDTTVPVLAKGKTRIGRLWGYVRDDRPFAGPDPPAAAFFYSRDRGGEHPEQHLAGYAGLMQADAYAGFNRLYEASRKPAPITEVACWSHARHNFFDLARLAKAPIAIEAVKRIDELFAIEREINGLSTQERVRVRNECSRPLMIALEAWLCEQRAKLSAQNNVSKAIAYCLTRWVALTRFLNDGRLCMSNNAAEREMRPI